jgi:hypothetical protein
MDFLDPRGEPSRPIDEYSQTATLKSGQSVGLMANGFPDSVAFLQHLEKALAHELPGVNFVHHDKGNASAIASEDDLNALAESCTAVVAAYGH